MPDDVAAMMQKAVAKREGRSLESATRSSKKHGREEENDEDDDSDDDSEDEDNEDDANDDDDDEDDDDTESDDESEHAHHHKHKKHVKLHAKHHKYKKKAQEVEEDDDQAQDADEKTENADDVNEHGNGDDSGEQLNRPKVQLKVRKLKTLSKQSQKPVMSLQAEREHKKRVALRTDGKAVSRQRASTVVQATSTVVGTTFAVHKTSQQVQTTTVTTTMAATTMSTATTTTATRTPLPQSSVSKRNETQVSPLLAKMHDTMNQISKRKRLSAERGRLLEAGASEEVLQALDRQLASLAAVSLPVKNATDNMSQASSRRAHTLLSTSVSNVSQTMSVDNKTQHQDKIKAGAEDQNVEDDDDDDDDDSPSSTTTTTTAVMDEASALADLAMAKVTTSLAISDENDSTNEATSEDSEDDTNPDGTKKELDPMQKWDKLKHSKSFGKLKHMTNSDLEAFRMKIISDNSIAMPERPKE